MRGRVVALLAGLLVLAPASAQARPTISLAQAHRIALRYALLDNAPDVAMSVQPCTRRTGTIDQAVCTLVGDDGEQHQEIPVVVRRLEHGYSVRLQRPALYVDHPWHTR